MTSVLIIATSPVLRAGLRALLYEEGITPVDAIASLGEVATTSAAEVWLVADDQLELISQPIRLNEGTQSIVLLSDDPHAINHLRALPLRGWALLSADAGGNELRAAIEATVQGLMVLPLALSGQLLNSPRFAPSDEDPVEPLTPREIEVLTLLGQGLPNKLIARQLTISEHTVKFHISSIFAKLGAASRTDAVSRGARAGLIVL
jgi:DNA-binding NarL/FixJ family response regulator